MRVRSLIVAIVVVLMGMVLAIPAQAYPAMPPGVQGPFTVIKVVDGDTIWVDNGGPMKIRMIGVDTPESVDPRKPVQCFALEASAQAKTILGGLSVYLETGGVDVRTRREARCRIFAPKGPSAASEHECGRSVAEFPHVGKASKQRILSTDYYVIDVCGTTRSVVLPWFSVDGVSLAVPLDLALSAKQRRVVHQL
jgi:hypothetical protein